MKLYSTNSPSQLVSLGEAVRAGLAPDGGLYLPSALPTLPGDFFKDSQQASFRDIAKRAAELLLADEIPSDLVERMVQEAFNFEVPFVPISSRIGVLELFHGPTLAFKDFGARFMARLMSYYRQEDRTITILTATSGDTGSAVAHGFLGMPGFRVVILYPSGKVSAFQEKQFATLGGNITALEVEGTFDDCQALAKQAFMDRELSAALALSSANSINIARLLPQSFYYLYVGAQLHRRNGEIPADLVFAVPSGNLGNLTAGVLAKRMGLPVKYFAAATNDNDSFARYIEGGAFTPKPSRQTISNAMDVGNPSNFARLEMLYEGSRSRMQAEIYSSSHSEDETRRAIAEVFERDSYVLDPHTAVAYLGLRSYMLRHGPCTGVVLATAHPAKFLNVIEEIIPGKVYIPEQLLQLGTREKLSIPLAADFSALKRQLLSLA